MNDDIISPKIQPTPAPSEPTAAPNDTEEQDTVSDRVFDFSDGDIKAVKDIDGPVTHSVNLEIAEALRNPAASIKKVAPLGTQPTSQTQPLEQPRSNQSSPTAWMPLSSVKKSPINKLEETPKDVLPSDPIPAQPPSHPPIDLSQQAPAVKVYSQIPHKSASAAPSSAPISNQLQKTPLPITPPQKESSTSQSPLSAKPADKNQAALEEILKKVHKRTQATPPSIKENLLDRNIGTLDASPFGTSSPSVSTQSFSSTVAQNPIPASSATSATSAQTLSLGGTQLISGKPTAIPLQDLSQPLNRARNTPSNPPAKIINTSDSGRSSVSAINGAINLQSAVGEIRSNNSQTPNTIPGTSTQFSELLKPLRTYEGDVADIMSHKKTSTASIAIAETKKTDGTERIADQEPQQSSHSILKIVMILLIVLLLGSGAFGGYYLYQKSPLVQSISRPNLQQTSQQARPGIIHADTYVVIPMNDELPTTILARIKSEVAKSQNPNSIKEIILGKKNTANTTATFTQISASDAIAALGIQSPNILNRSLTPDWMLGIYSNQVGEKSAFVIVTTNFFQNAFAGMLSWENNMADDLKQYISTQVSGIANTQNVPNIPAMTGSTTTLSSTSTISATTTPSEFVQPLKQYLTIRGTFEDRIVKNKDVRAFRTADGSILFVYSFIDNTHLALAGSEEALREVLTRLEKQASIR